MAMQVVQVDLPGSPKKTKIVPRWVRIGKRAAQQLVFNTKETNAPQRNQCPATIEKYAAEMQAGTWFTSTGEVIQIALVDGFPVVINGLHRVKAVILSGIPLDLWVMEGVPVDAFKYMDGGKSRDLNQVMASAGWKDATIMAVVGQLLFKREHTGTPLANYQLPAPGSVLEWLNENEPELHGFWADNSGMIKKAAKNTRVKAPVLYYHWLSWAEVDQDLADEIMLYLGDHNAHNPPHKVFAYARDFLVDLNDEVLEAKAARRPINTNTIRRVQLEALNFAWLQSTTKKRSRITTVTGFKKALNKWSASPEEGAWLLT